MTKLIWIRTERDTDGSLKITTSKRTFIAPEFAIADLKANVITDDEVLKDAVNRLGESMIYDIMHPSSRLNEPPRAWKVQVRDDSYGIYMLDYEG